METVRVGIREFRENMASYVLQGGAPVAVTRHGDTVGYFIPTRPRLTEEQLRAFDEAAAKWQQSLDAAGIGEKEIDDILEDFKKLRKADRR